MTDRVCVNVGLSVFDFRTLVSILCTQLNRTVSAGTFLKIVVSEYRESVYTK